MSDQKESALNIRENRMRKEAEQMAEKYQPQIDMLEKSLLAKAKGSIDSYDVWALGKQLAMWEAYTEYCNESGSTNQLGQLPKVALDVITAVQGTSIIPVIASVQPIEEEKGIVYFKQVRSYTTKGSQSANDLLVDPRRQLVTPQGYANNLVPTETLGTGDGSVKTFSGTLAARPLRSETIKVYQAGVLVGRDIGVPEGGTPFQGVIWGNGVAGTVDYETGVVSLTFATAPISAAVVAVSYQQNLERATDLPQVYMYFDSKTIQANIYALKATQGMLQSFALQKRFGISMEDELSKMLVTEINREIGGDLIRRLVTVAVGTTTFHKVPPANVSYFEHKQVFKDALADAEAKLVGNAGRGTITQIIAGRQLAALISTLPGFTKLSDGASLGAHIFGTLDGMVVVRVNEQNLLDSKTAICVWKGPTPFEAAAVYCPYMPLAMTGTLPEAPNPLGSMKAAAVWAGVDTLVDVFATKLVMDDSNAVPSNSFY